MRSAQVLAKFIPKGESGAADSALRPGRKLESAWLEAPPGRG